MLDLDFEEFSDAGPVRANNEDSLGHYQPATPAQGRSHGWLFVLADGVGGQDRGEVASKAAVDQLIVGFSTAPAGEPLAALLPRLIRAANAHIYELGKSQIATTVVACALRHDRAVIAHAGDSRCYLVRQKEARSLTRDHRAAENVLSRSLGTELFVNVDCTEVQLQPGDCLVLCCDGVHHSVTEADLIEICGRNGRAQDIADLARQRDGSDNMSVQLIRIRSVERVGMYRGRPYQLR